MFPKVHAHLSRSSSEATGTTDAISSAKLAIQVTSASDGTEMRVIYLASVDCTVFRLVQRLIRNDDFCGPDRKENLTPSSMIEARGIQIRQQEKDLTGAFPEITYLLAHDEEPHIQQKGPPKQKERHAGANLIFEEEL